MTEKPDKIDIQDSDKKEKSERKRTLGINRYKSSSGLATLLKQTVQNEVQNEAQHLTKEFKRSIDKIITNNTSLTDFRVRKPLTQFEFATLADAISSNTVIVNLEITGTRCGELGAKELSESLRHNNTITSLELRRNFFGEQGAQHILSGIAKNFTLLKIDLEMDAPKNQSTFHHIEKLFDTLNLVRIDHNKSSVFQPIRHSTKKRIEAILETNRSFKRFSEGDHDTLEMSNRNLTEIPALVFQKSHILKSLTLMRNALKTLNDVEFGKLTNLTYLNLSFNNLTCLPYTIGRLVHLKGIDISHNKLTEIPVSISMLDSLVAFNVSKNHITELPDSIALLKSLEHFNAAKNRLKGFSRELARDPIALLNQLRSNIEGKKSVVKANLIVLGELNSGRTTLLRALRRVSVRRGRITFRARSQSQLLETNGHLSSDTIDVSDWIVQVPRQETDSISFTTIDFAGQEAFRYTHQFLLQERSVYLVVFDLTAPKEKWHLEFWLRSISSRTSSASIIIVGSHTDDNSCNTDRLTEVFNMLQISFATRYKNIRGVYFVSSTTGVGIDELRNFIIDAAWENQSFKEELPMRYCALQEKIASLREFKVPPLLTFDEWSKLVVGIGIPEKDVEHATNHFTDLNEIMYHKGITGPGDQELVILDPQWLSDALALLLTLKKNNSTGFLSVRHLEVVWKAPDYPADLYSFIIKIFSKFHMIFDLPDSYNQNLASSSLASLDSHGYKYLLPILLPNKEPSFVKEKWPSVTEDSQLERIYTLTFLPVGFVHRLIARILYFLDEELVLWRNGTLFKKGTELGLIVADPTKQSIRIHIRGQQPLNLLQALIDNIENLALTLSSNNKIYKILVPCPHCIAEEVEPVFMFSMKRMEEVWESGNNLIECNAVAIRIEDLAPDITLADVDLLEYSSLEIEKQVGSGGYATVYKGKTQNGDVVAIKQLHFESEKEILGPEQYQERIKEFRREVSMMNVLYHANIVKLIGMTKSPTCIITEFMPHGDLAGLLLSQDEVSDQLRDKIIWDIANGIYYLHSRSPPIIHRDLKTPNVLLASLNPSDSIVAKISDFGTSMHSVWLNGRVVDNPTWLAPEVMRGLEYSIESDVYSFGITLWEICTREQAFAEYNVRFMSQLEDQILKGLRPSSRPNIPKTYEDIIAKCTLDDPKSRLTMAQVVVLLSEFLNLPPPENPVNIKKRKKRAITKSSEFISLSARNSKSLLSIPGSISGHRRNSALETIPNLPSNLARVESETSLRNSGSINNRQPSIPSSPLKSPPIAEPSEKSASNESHFSLSSSYESSSDGSSHESDESSDSEPLESSSSGSTATG